MLRSFSELFAADEYPDFIPSLVDPCGVDGDTFALGGAGAIYDHLGRRRGLIIASYTGTSSAVTIPATIGGKPVTAIGLEALGSNTTLTSVVIPAGVTTLGQGAFDSCIQLTSVMIPSSVTTIGDVVFSGCTSLTSVTILRA